MFKDWLVQFLAPPPPPGQNCAQVLKSPKCWIRLSNAPPQEEMFPVKESFHVVKICYTKCDQVRFVLLCEQQTNDFSQIRIYLAKSKAKQKQQQ